MNFYTFGDLSYGYFGTYRYVKTKNTRQLYFSGFTFYPRATRKELRYVTDMEMNPARPKNARFKKAKLKTVPKIYRDYFKGTTWLIEMYNGQERRGGLGREFTI